MNVRDYSHKLRSSRIARAVGATSIVFCGAVAGAIVLASCGLLTYLVSLTIVDMIGIVLREAVVYNLLLGTSVVSIVIGMIWGAFRVGRKFRGTESLQEDDQFGVSLSKDETAVCGNCGSSRQGRWCSACGQNDRDYRRLLLVLSEVVGEMFEADSRVWRTLKNLFLKPGLLALEFSRNRRANYLSPFRMYLFASLLYFLLVSFFSGPSDTTAGVTDVADTESVADDPIDPMRTFHFFEYLPLTALLAIPLYASMLQFLNIGRHNFVHHFVFVLHLQTIGFLVLILFIPWMMHGVYLWQYTAYFLLVSVYLLFAMRRFYGTNWLHVIVRWVVAAWLYVAMFLMVVFVTEMVVIR